MNNEIKTEAKIQSNGQTPDFNALVQQVAQLQSIVESLVRDQSKGIFGNSKYIKQTYNFAKGRITIGFGDEIVIFDALDANFLMWAGNVDPALANFRLDRGGNVV